MLTPWTAVLGRDGDGNGKKVRMRWPALTQLLSPVEVLPLRGLIPRLVADTRNNGKQHKNQ